MIASMFNLEHRLAELRPTEDELRIARQLRKEAAPQSRPARAAGVPNRNGTSNAPVGGLLTRVAAD